VHGRRGPAYWLLAAFFGLFVLFLYGPTLTILVLSFQGPSGGLTFPMNGVSVHWFKNLFEKQMVGDFAGSLQRSMILGVAATLVNGDLHRTLVSDAQAGSAEHLSLLAPLVRFHKATSGIIYVYTAILAKDRVYPKSEHSMATRLVLSGRTSLLDRHDLRKM